MLGTLWPVVSCCRQSDVEDGRLIKDDRGLTNNSVLQVAQKNDMESKYYCQVDFFKKQQQKKDMHVQFLNSL